MVCSQSKDEHQARLLRAAWPDKARGPGPGQASTGPACVSQHYAKSCLDVYVIINFVIIHVNNIFSRTSQ